MLLAIDIGNTNIVFGIYQQGEWRHHWRIQTNTQRMPDEYAVLFHQLFNEVSLNFKQFSKIIISSVVPPLTLGFKNMIKQRSELEPLVINSKTNTGIILRTTPPENTGTDLIANAVAAYQRFQDNCIVVDFGTATSIIAVAKPGEFLGGAFTAGLNTTANALADQTAQLPKIALEAPPKVIGNNTIHAMQSGLVVGHICLVEGIIDRMKKELGHAQVIATGGLAAILGHLTDRFDAVDPWLTLTGLKLIAEMN